MNTIESITEFLHNKYLSSKPKELLSNTDLLKAENLSKKLKNDNFIITNEEKNWSIATGKYIKYNIKFSDKSGEVLFDSKKGMFCYSTYDKIEYFDDLEKCILSYKHYLDIKE